MQGTCQVVKVPKILELVKQQQQQRHCVVLEPARSRRFACAILVPLPGMTTVFLLFFAHNCTIVIKYLLRVRSDRSSISFVCSISFACDLTRTIRAISPSVARARAIPRSLSHYFFHAILSLSVARATRSRHSSIPLAITYFFHRLVRVFSIFPFFLSPHAQFVVHTRSFLPLSTAR